MLGAYARVFDGDDVLKLLHSRVKSAGGQSAFARETGVETDVPEPGAYWQETTWRAEHP
jgi:hypothetical protein